MAKDVENLQIRLDLETGDFSQQIKAISSAVTNLDKQFRQLSKGLDDNSFQKYALEIDHAKKSMDLLNKQIEIQQKQAATLTEELEKQKKKREELIKAGKQDTSEFQKNDKLIAQNTRKLNNYSASIDRNQTKIKQYANEILKANDAVQKLSDETQTLEQKLSKISNSEALKASEFNLLNSELEQTSNFFKKLSKEINELDTARGFNTQKIKAYTDEVEKLEREQSELVSKQSDLRSKIKSTEQALQGAKSEYGETSEEVSQLEYSLAALKDELRGVNTSLDSNADSLQDYRKNINDLEADNNRLNKSLASIKFDTIGDKLQSVGGTIKNIGSTLTQNVSVPMAAAGVAIAKMGMDYQTALTKVGMITGLQGKELQAYGEQLVEVSNKSGIAVTDLIESTYQAISSGVEVGDAIQFVSSASDLARAGFAEQTDAVDLLAKMYNIYGDTLGSVSQVSDKFIKTQDLGVTTVGELSTEIAEASAIGAAYGVNLDNILASYVKLTKSGYNTAESTM